MDLVTPKQTDNELIYLWNQTKKNFQSTLTLDQIFQAQANKTPQNIAVQDVNSCLNYQELDRLSNQLAHHILNSAGPQLLVGICLERSVDTIIAILGILKAGAAYLPIDPAIPTERLEYILNNTQCKLVITHKKQKKRFKRTPLEQIVIDANQYRKETVAQVPQKHNQDSLAYIIFTSGTTGLPKGVAVSHHSIINRLEWMQNQYQFTAQDIILQKTPYTFDVSVWELLLAHQIGASIYFPPQNAHQNPKELHEIITINHISVMHFVPSMLSSFNNYCQKNNLSVPESLRYVFCSGEALYPAQVNNFYALSHHPLEIHNLYGPTEAAVDVTYSFCPKNCSKVYIGKPIQNIQIHILNEQLESCSIGEIGEIYIAGVGLAKEYYNRPELTQERFVYINHLRHYKTGDLASWCANGEIEYYGRNDSQIKLRGYRIELGEIEKTLTKLRSIENAAVLCKQQNGQDLLIAYYEGKKDLPSQKILAHLKKYLPDYMIPAGFIRVEQFPLTANGKLCRKTLGLISISTKKILTSTISDTEEMLAHIWQEALNTTDISKQDDFFLLGGNSLSAAYIVADVHEKLYRHIEVADVYKHPTIELLAKKLSKIKTTRHRNFSKKDWLNNKFLPLTDFQVLLWFSNLFEPKAKKMNVVTRKRLKGQLDTEKFQQALAEIVNRQLVLHYKVAKLWPAQRIKPEKLSNFNLEIKHLGLDACSILNASMLELNKLNRWPRNVPKVKARVFLIADHETEIQLCMSHMICDETSMRILWDELSTAYQKQELCELNSSYQDYIIEEQYENNLKFSKKYKFWSDYLRQATLISFPVANVITNMHKNKQLYSEYYEIPEQLINSLKEKAALKHTNISTILCAILAVSLESYLIANDSKKILINLIKSTRSNHKYDNILGCMVRVDPILVDLQYSANINTVINNIQNDINEIHSLQSFSSILKFSFHDKHFKIGKLLRTLCIKTGLYLYTNLIPIIKRVYTNHNVFYYCWRLAAFERKNIFIINLNLWNNFLSPADNTDYFGLKAATHDMVPYELIQIDDLLDICFIRDHSNHKPYLVISGNLDYKIKNNIKNLMFEMLSNL